MHDQLFILDRRWCLQWANALLVVSVEQLLGYDCDAAAQAFHLGYVAVGEPVFVSLAFVLWSTNVVCGCNAGMQMQLLMNKATGGSHQEKHDGFAFDKLIFWCRQGRARAAAKAASSVSSKQPRRQCSGMACTKAKWQIGRALGTSFRLKMKWLPSSLQMCDLTAS